MSFYYNISNRRKTKNSHQHFRPSYPTRLHVLVGTETGHKFLINGRPSNLGRGKAPGPSWICHWFYIQYLISYLHWNLAMCPIKRGYWLDYYNYNYFFVFLFCFAEYSLKFHYFRTKRILIGHKRQLKLISPGQRAIRTRRCSYSGVGYRGGGDCVK